MIESLPFWSCVPFVLLLLCIAVFPLIPATRHLWEKRRVQLAVALILGLPVGVAMWALGASENVVHALVEYVQFIALLLSLFVVSGGVYIAGDLRAEPRVNVAFLACGALLASLIGTTGAAMLLIRPILRTNQQRTIKAHTIVFTIFIVANCGGLLTPLGDPPLFLGMLRGVPFTWTLSLFPAWLLVNGLLLLVYWAIERRAYAMEPESALALDRAEATSLSIEGKGQLLCFGAIIAAVALVPSIDLEAMHHGGASWQAFVPWREIVMLGAAAASYFLGDRRRRFELNAFRWGPIQEVAALFIGIFLTMIPALILLRQMAPGLPLNAVSFFAFTGALSSVLDNAPTYVTFFEMARELAFEGPRVAGVPVPYLVAISLGAVFGGAITYLGNGPNFMVKAVAEDAKVPMPSFGGYVARWSLVFFVPVLAVLVLVVIAEAVWLKLIGVALALLIAACSLMVGVKYRRAPSPAPSVSEGSEARTVAVDRPTKGAGHGQ